MASSTASRSSASRSPGTKVVRALLTFVLWAVAVTMAVFTAVAIWHQMGTPLGWLKMFAVAVLFGVAAQLVTPRRK